MSPESIVINKTQEVESHSLHHHKEWVVFHGSYAKVQESSRLALHLHLHLHLPATAEESLKQHLLEVEQNDRAKRL